METDYEKQAQDFLDKTETSFKAEYLKTGKYFDDEKEERDIYTIELKRGERKFIFTFGQSINDSGYKVRVKKTGHIWKRLSTQEGNDIFKSQKHLNWWKHRTIDGYCSEVDEIIKPVQPSPYDVLACLTKYDVGTFENFCSEFGYDTDSRRAEKTYQAVVNEFKNIQTLFTDKEIEELREIN